MPPARPQSSMPAEGVIALELVQAGLVTEHRAVELPADLVALAVVVAIGEHDALRLTPGSKPTQALRWEHRVDQGSRVGDEVALTVTSVLQTSAGRMIFGRLDGRTDVRPSRGRR